MRVLAVDYGRKRIGLAVSDPGRTMAFPRPTLALASKKQALAAIEQLAKTEDVAEIVVGLPLAIGGEATDMSREAQEFGRALAARCRLPLHFVDERLTSAEAEEMLRQAGVRHKDMKGKLDGQAAVLILESFLGGHERSATQPAGSGEEA